MGGARGPIGKTILDHTKWTLVIAVPGYDEPEPIQHTPASLSHQPFTDTLPCVSSTYQVKVPLLDSRFKIRIYQQIQTLERLKAADYKTSKRYSTTIIIKNKLF